MMLPARVSSAVGCSRRVASAAVRPSVVTRRQVVVRAAADSPVCLVTGSSRGIGKECAIALGSTGAKVVITYSNNAAAADEVAKAVEAAGGEAMISGPINMGKKEDIDKLFAEVTAKWGKVNVLVNNAGITKDGLMMMMKPADWQAVIDVNLTGVFLASQAASKMMRKQKGGRIINISSVVGIIGNAGQANYTATKGGVIALTKTIAREYAASGILCNAIAPGLIETDMASKMDEKYRENILKSIPLGRFGNPKEVAGLVKFLALDPAAAYITGQCYNIDGGMVMN